MILDQAFRYITELKKQNDTMLLEGGDKVQGKWENIAYSFLECIRIIIIIIMIISIFSFY